MIGHAHNATMGNFSAKVNQNSIIEYLQKSPPGILKWPNTLLDEFSQCFKIVKVKPGKEVSQIGWYGYLKRGI